MPLCLLCEKLFNNDAMKLTKVKNTLKDLKNKNLEYSMTLKGNLKIRSDIERLFIPSFDADTKGGLKA